MTLYRFGRCELDTERARLLVAGIERHVEPKVFKLLHHLVSNEGKVSGHGELVNEVWQGRVVSDSAISVAINAARKAVGDSGSRQEVIKTVPRKGFQLAVDVSSMEQGNSQTVDGNGAQEADRIARPVVGVFPFDPHGNVPAYLVRGVAEDIATELSRFHSIEVLAPYSTFRHDFSSRDVRQVASELGVTHIVSGSVREQGDLRRIGVWLESAESGSRIWSEKYEVSGEDFFDAQDDAVHQIVASLVQGLTEHQSAVARKKPTASLSAYECVLRGLQIYKWGVNSREEARQAIFWFDRAIELDENYARARAWRECSRSSLWSSPPQEAQLQSTIDNMVVALSMDENDHEVQRLTGAIYMCAGEHELGDYHLAKAVELNPNDAHILLKIGMYRSFLSDDRDNLTYIDTAFQRNPAASFLVLARPGNRDVFQGRLRGNHRKHPPQSV